MCSIVYGTVAASWIPSSVMFNILYVHGCMRLAHHEIYQGLFSLVAKLWDSLRAELSSVFNVIERVANECYQINLIVDEAFVNEFSAKIP